MNSFKNKWLLIFMSAVLALGTAIAADDKEQQENSKGYKALKSKMLFSKQNIDKRTKPVGNIYVEGDDVPAAAPPPVAESTGPRGGADVYTANCSACHASGVGGAPKMGDAIWKELSQQGVDTLLQTVISGKGIMPPKGGCASCSDDELKLAVEHMMASAN